MARRTRSAASGASAAVDGRARPAWGWIAGGLACATAATLLLEIVVTRIFSVVLIYHFAFMAISLALFGLGLAGIAVYLWPELFPRERLSRTASALALAFAAATVGALALFHAFVQDLYLHRRKNLSGALLPLLKTQFSKAELDGVLKGSRFDPSGRAEALSVEEHLRLFDVLSAAGERPA